MANINIVGREDVLRQMDEFMRFIFFPVGHGSCTLVSFPPEEPNGPRIYGVIDCHDRTARPIRAYLGDPWFDGEIVSGESTFRLRFVALTHYDQDHFLGIDYLLGKNRDFIFDHFLCPFPAAGAIADRIESHPRKKKILSDIQKLAPDPSFLQIYQDCTGMYRPRDNYLKDIFKAMAIAPSSKAMRSMKELRSLEEITPPNILSSAIRFQWGDCSVIIAGDVEEGEWRNIIGDLISRDQAYLLSANVALCSHHGGRGNPDELWQQISRCSFYHKRDRDTERRVCRTLVVIPCSSHRESCPSKDSLQTFFSATSLFHCTAPAKVCLDLHKGHQPSCVSDIGDDAGEDRIELLPGEQPIRDNMCDLPPFASKPKRNRDFKRGSICVDIFPKKAPNLYYHNGAKVVEIKERCSICAKLEGHDEIHPDAVVNVR
ncbi:MAG: hypothetical protein JW976_01935 [Syntrophaceae bacterium]|nr:hypothetical protein [Syntrophaceae bacterium]